MTTETTESLAEVTWDYCEGQLVRLYCGRPEQAWELYEAPEWALRAALRWNDLDADEFDDSDAAVFAMAELIETEWRDDSVSDEERSYGPAVRLWNRKGE